MAVTAVPPGQLKSLSVINKDSKTASSLPPLWLRPFLIQKNNNKKVRLNSTSRMTTPSVIRNSVLPHNKAIPHHQSKPQSDLLTAYFPATQNNKRYKPNNPVSFQQKHLEQASKIPESLNIIQWNLMSLKKRKIVDVLQSCQEKKIHVLCLQETWHNSPSELPKLKNFTVYSRARNIGRTHNSTRGGGVCIYIHNSIAHCESARIDPNSNDTIEDQVEVKIKLSHHRDN